MQYNSKARAPHAEEHLFFETNEKSTNYKTKEEEEESIGPKSNLQYFNYLPSHHDVALKRQSFFLRVHSIHECTFKDAIKASSLQLGAKVNKHKKRKWFTNNIRNSHMVLVDSNLVCKASISKNGTTELRKAILQLDFHARGSKVTLPVYGNWNCLGAKVLRVRYFKQNVRVWRVRSTG